MAVSPGPSQQSLRILMVISQFRPCIGGAERQAERLALELARRGHRVEVLTRPHPGQPAAEEWRGIRIRRALRTLPLGKLWGLSYLVSVLWELWKARRQFDIFHLHQLYLHTASAALVRCWGGPPVLVKLVNSGEYADWLLLEKMAGGRLLLPWARKVDRAVAICRRLEEEMLTAGFSPGQVVRIPNGVDADFFLPSSDISPVPGRILFLGRLDPYKGLLTLLDAMEKLRNRVAGAHLQIVGEGPLQQKLSEAIDRRGMGRFVTVWPFVEDVRAEYGQAAAVVLPSTAEGMSNVMLEAMACGRPIVASRVGGADDLLEGPNGADLPRLAPGTFHTGRAGILVEPGDSAALAAALEQVLEDTALAWQMGAGARRAVCGSFSIQAIADRYEALYRELLLSGK